MAHLFPDDNPRGNTICTLQINQLYNIIKARIEYYHPDKNDPDAFCQNVCCEIEKAMGIYPNVPKLEADNG